MIRPLTIPPARVFVFLAMLGGFAACGGTDVATPPAGAASLSNPEASADAANASPANLADTLSGTWRRTTYPHGEIVFEGSRVKRILGEGTFEEPTFESYRLTDACPEGKPSAGRYLVYGETCQSIRFGNDTLYLGVGGPYGDEIPFRKLASEELGAL